MKFYPIFASCLILMSVGRAWGYDEERAKNNFAHELVECAAYYDIGAEGIKRAGNVEGAAATKAASMHAMELARNYSKDDVVLARYKLALEEHIKTIDGNYSNLSVLTVKYKDICKQAIENPNDRFKYWKNMK